MNAAELKAKMALQAEAIACMLLPSGRREGNEWVAGSIHGEAGTSLKVHLLGTKAGVWKDFAEDGRGGDLLDLWCATKGVSFAVAYKEALNYMGVSRPPEFLPRRKTYTRPERPKCTSPRGKVLAYLTGERKLSLEAIQAYRIAGSLDDSEVIFPFLRDGELLNVKHLKLERPDREKIIRQANNAEPCLMGWQVIPDNARTVCIAEGELDAMTLFDYGVPALSVCAGAGNLQWIESDFERLQRFSEIFLCFDNDPAGEKGVSAVAARLGSDRCRVVRLPHKDANLCAQMGVPAEEIAKCFSESATRDPAELKSAKYFEDEVIAEFYGDNGAQAGLDLPWDSMRGKAKLRRAEFTIWTGTSSHGKTTLLGHVMLEMAKMEERICMFSGEMMARRLLYKLCRQATALRDPAIQHIRAVHSWMDGKFWLFDVVGTAKADRILEVFRYAHRRYGITFFLIDSLMKCGIEEDDYKGQKAFCDALCDFKNEADVHVAMVAHPRKGEDEISVRGKEAVKGTGAIGDLCDSMFWVWRNLKKDDGDTEPDAMDGVLYCKKQRNGDGWQGKLPLWFDQDSMRYVNRFGEKPRPYVHFSELYTVEQVKSA